MIAKVQTTAKSPPIADKARFNPFGPDYALDPYPQLHRLRAEDPVHYSTTLGVWMLTRYADVHAAFRDSRFSSETKRWDQYQKFFLRGGSTTSPMAETYGKWMLQLDAPDHTRLRSLVNKAFTPRVVEAMRERIQVLVDELIDGIAERGSMEVMSDLAFPLPILVICDLLGVPRTDYERIRTWTHALLPSLSPAISVAGLARVNEVILEFREYFRDLANQRRAEPKNDMMSALLGARENGQKLNEDELLATCILLAFAGHATTAQLIGRAVHIMLAHPDQLAKLHGDPSLIAGTIEETLRYESMLQMVYRATKEQVTIGDKTIPAGQMVFLSIAAANRDPAMFADPDKFDITRDATKHLSFAYGPHYCVGAPLARLEGQLAVGTLLRRLPDLRLVSEGIRREPSLLLRGLTHLPLTFTPPGKHDVQPTASSEVRV